MCGASALVGFLTGASRQMSEEPKRAAKPEGVGLTCPNCSASVKLGDITCPQCGTNMRTGESYDSKVKRARADELHPEHFAGRIGFGIVVLFGLVVMAGFLYQQRVEKMMRNDEQVFTYYLRRVEEVDVLISQGKTSLAKQKGQELIDQLNKAEQSIIIEDAPTTDMRNNPNIRPKGERVAEKTQFKNLIVKLQYKLADLR